MRSKLYGVFLESQKYPNRFRFAMTRNKKIAINAIKEEGWGEVRAMPLPYGNSAWDCPTFYTCSEQIFKMEE